LIKKHKIILSNPLERELWNKIKARELNSTNVNAVNLTKDIHRNEKSGFFPSTFVKKLNPDELPNKESDNKTTDAMTQEKKVVKKEINSAFNSMGRVKNEEEIVMVLYFLTRKERRRTAI
jgi:superoxide dismutase